MSQENSQLDMTDRQILAVSPQPASVWTEIGEARITHNIFGKAKVRIVRKNNGLRRAMWWTAWIVVVVVIAWSGWEAFRPAGQEQSADSLPHVTLDAQENASPSPQGIASSTPAPAGSMSMRSEAAKPPSIEKKSAQSELASKSIVPVHKPLAPRSSLAKKPQVVRPLPPRQETTPTAPVTAAVKPAASSPDAVMQLSSPVMEEESKPQQPAQQNQPVK